MKKFFIFAFALVLLIGLSACSKTAETEKSKLNEPTVEASIIEETMAAEDEDHSATVTSIQDDQEIKANLEKKSSKPVDNLDAETILSWVKKPTTIEDVNRLGCEVSLEFSSPRMDVYEWYKIENTDIRLMSIWDTTNITSILAPAELLIPEHIGTRGNEFYINDVLVIPNATGYGNPFVPYGWNNDDVITKDTPVLVITEVSFNTAVADGGWEATFDEFYGTSYLFEVNNEAYNIYSNPTYASTVIQILPIGTYTIIEEQTDSDGNIWGKLKSGLGWICLTPPENEGVATEQYGACTQCGRPISAQNFVFEGFGLCRVCYDATLDPAYICDNCGCDCSFIGTIDGLCEVCYNMEHSSGDGFCVACGRGGITLDVNSLCESCANGACVWCGGPLGDAHNCDDYPNVICPNCGWGMFTTGVGVDGIICPECETRVV